MATDVTTGGPALARCVACPAPVFAEENWGRAPRLSRSAELPADFTDLLDQESVDELVSERGLRTPFLRVAKDGAVRPATSFTRGGGAGASIADQAADDKVLAELAAGSTLVLQGLHRTWPPLVDFSARLADELGHPVQINAYVTPPQNQGFAPHHDVHDVFVLQVSGRKHWTVHSPVVDDPLGNQPFDGFKGEIAERVAQAPQIDTVLEPGDALYLPRGTVHSAQALGETSIHLTIGVHPADPLRPRAVPAGCGPGRPAATRFAAHGRRPGRSRCARAAPGHDRAALQDALEHVPAARIASGSRRT